MKIVPIAMACALALSSCTTTDGNVEAAKAFDRVCSAEPPLYASFVAIAESKGASEKTMRRAEALHASISALCNDRPTDVISALVTLTAAYAQFAAINAQYK